MQRLGRINRIGTKADKIWNYNFYPSTLGDNQINLKNRTYVKLQAFHELFGEDSQIYTTQEEVKHFDKIVRDEAGEEESQIMPYITELKDFKKSNADEYEKLSAIKNNVVCSTIKNMSLSGLPQQSIVSFSALHETEGKNGHTISSLYITLNGRTEKTSQLEFFEKLKPLSILKSSEVDSVILEKCKKSVLTCYEAEKQNSLLSMKSKLRAGAKEINAATKKIQSLYSTPDLSDEYISKLDDIADSISNKNFTLINKVLNADFTNDGLGTIKLESEIEYLHKFIASNHSETTAEVAIEFVEIVEQDEEK